MDRGFVHSNEDVAPVSHGNEGAELKEKALNLLAIYGQEV